jgi:hypothetical protein
MDELKLNCWIVGDEFGHIFSVSVARSEQVTELRKAIKLASKERLANIDPHHLDLWKVSINIDDFNKKTTESLQDNQRMGPLDICLNFSRKNRIVNVSISLSEHPLVRQFDASVLLAQMYTSPSLMGCSLLSWTDNWRSQLCLLDNQHGFHKLWELARSGDMKTFFEMQAINRDADPPAQDVNVPLTCCVVKDDVSGILGNFLISGALVRDEYSAAINDAIMFCKKRGELKTMENSDVDAMLIDDPPEVSNDGLPDTNPFSSQFDSSAAAFVLQGHPGIGEHAILPLSCFVDIRSP